ncbi:MAG: DUF1761 domain-containing protein [Gemmatimonadaceae bacterium]|nr:DUF1761 domain-containing protein [Gemmatimonadaceae bacterium]
MALPDVNYLAVLVAGILIFLLGGLWYSPVLFAKRWVGLMGKNDDETRAAAAGNMAGMYLLVFLCGLATAFALAVVILHFPPFTPLRGVLVAMLCWIGFTGATSYGTNMFSMQPRALWMINAGYNLVAFVVAGLLLVVWR